MMNNKYLLGSASPRRKDLLEKAGLDISTISINIDESFDSSMNVNEVAEYLAIKKSMGFQGSLEDNILITADTVVIIEGMILNKPKTSFEAKQMLLLLSGKSHMVNTGVCIRNSQNKLSFTESTEVSFKNLSEQEIDYYITNFQPFDKAGSYGIQDWIGLIGIEGINGCYYNVMGFPVSRFLEYVNKL